MTVKKLISPNELAQITNVNKSTLLRYLSDRETFPPNRIDPNNGYRYYDDNVIIRLKLYKLLQKRPFRLRAYEIKKIFNEADINRLLECSNKSTISVFEYLEEMGFF